MTTPPALRVCLHLAHAEALCRCRWQRGRGLRVRQGPTRHGNARVGPIRVCGGGSLRRRRRGEPPPLSVLLAGTHPRRILATPLLQLVIAGLADAPRRLLRRGEDGPVPSLADEEARQRIQRSAVLGAR